MDESTFEWGVRDHPTHGEDIWSDLWEAWRGEASLVPPPFTEETARARVRAFYMSGYQLLRRAVPGREPEVVDYRPAPMDPLTDAEFPDVATEIKDGIPIGLLGEDGETAVALGHIDPAAMAEAVTTRLNALHEPDEIEPFDAVNVDQVHAIRVDGEWVGDPDGWGLIWRWPDKSPVTAETDGAFALTVLDVPW